jgi:hypothetical protein
VEAATFNSQRLLEFKFDVEAATQQPQNTILLYGAEFRPTKLLEPLLQNHPNWKQMKSIIENGVEYPLSPIDNDTRLSDIDTMIMRGNHQSTTTPENKLALTKAIDKEVNHQWAIPLVPSCIKKIPDSSVTPLGVE